MHRDPLDLHLSLNWPSKGSSFRSVRVIRYLAVREQSIYSLVLVAGSTIRRPAFLSLDERTLHYCAVLAYSSYT